MEEIIILDKSVIPSLDLSLIKQGCFYTTFECIEFFAHPNMPYSKVERLKIKENIGFMSENNKVIVIKKDTNIRDQLKEYIEGFFPMLTVYDIKEYEGGLHIPEKLKEDSSFFIDCILCSLANEGEKVIIFTTNLGIIEMFGIFSQGLEAAKLLILHSKEESNFLG